MSEVRENLTYEGFGQAVRELAQTVADDGYEPDVVLSIARGGVFVAGGLAYALDCKNIHLVNVEFYTGVGTTLEMPSKDRFGHHRDELGMTLVVPSKSHGRVRGSVSRRSTRRPAVAARCAGARRPAGRI
ncbi:MULTISPECIES: phosphoribosyltransferase family protein [unclassified Streptomyces]|uniref:phosphoribosyltransferase n=1 Tax=unclassified Streptomyces TaxID=2593676 RepID=UPI000AB6738A